MVTSQPSCQFSFHLPIERSRYVYVFGEIKNLNQTFHYTCRFMPNYVTISNAYHCGIASKQHSYCANGETLANWLQHSIIELQTSAHEDVH